MKTLTTAIQENRKVLTTARRQIIPAVVVSGREILAVLSAVTAATAVVLLSVWVAGMEMSNISGATTWGLAFIFIGLAVDNRAPTAILQLATGVALLVLAWLQNSISADFTIASGVLVAAWLAAVIFRSVR